jgi:misacylated tRNA(Ala) deacylase
MMRTECLYLKDAYLREFPARVDEVAGSEIVLDRTAFHPAGGGQPDDLGRIRFEGGAAAVTGLRTENGRIVHATAPEGALPSVGEAVTGEIDWGRRYSFMRGHTMLHLLSGVVYHRFESGITGGQIYEGRARMDFTLAEFGRPLAEELVGAVNELVLRDLPIRVRFISRSEAEATPSFVRVATALPGDVTEIRLIDIGGFDVQADGGTHVRSTREVGTVTLGKLENKGARNKRLYLELGDGFPAASEAVKPALDTRTTDSNP